jgi:bifunctional UDP-N-acetylglucosamine pyrophosphorylase/glucosamine-1-phosphate N-acetyltransferase
MLPLHVVVLAAGKGTRMRSDRAKVLHRLAGVPMIDYVLDTAAALAPATTVVVIGHQADSMRAALAGRPGLGFAVQTPQLGTAHALLSAEPLLQGAEGTLVLLSGDVPLLSPRTLERLVDRHHGAHAAATVLTAVVDAPAGYGRIVRAGERFERIVEDRDATAAEREIREINAGVYAFALRGLFDAVRAVAADNAQHEFYLPDLVAIYRRRGLPVETVALADPQEVLGINSRADLAALGRRVWDAKNAALMTAGVTLEDPATAYIGREVEIGSDTIVHPGVTLEGRTRIGARCEIRSGVRIADSTLGDDVVVLDHSVVTDSTIASGARVGPFAHLRNGVAVGADARVGNFVEVKKTVLGEGSKALHLTYLGDAVIGANVNIGAGVITCNYDGVTKHQTTIEDGAFVGSDTQLIAPVTVGRGAYVGTGTTVREDVPAGALAVSAGPQRNIRGWVKNRKKPGKKRGKKGKGSRIKN